MSIDFSKLSHSASHGPSKEQTDASDSQKDKELPPEMRTILYKTYPRLPRISLPKKAATSSVLEAIKNRSSTRSFKGTSIPLGTLATILEYSCGEIGAPVANGKKRAQPSGGPLYPIETYVCVFRSSQELASGVYHYNVKDHALELLWAREFTKTDINELFTYDWIEDASAAIVLTGVFDRTKRKYGQQGYRFALLEAGHIGQNIYLTAGELGIGCCAMGGTRDKTIEKILQIDGDFEAFISSFILGA